MMAKCVPLLKIWLMLLLPYTVLSIVREDLTEEDYKTLQNNLVVLKGKIDEGFSPEGKPLKLEGTHHIATLTKYTNSEKCFQLLSIETDMADVGKGRDSVKVSCAMSVPDPDMKTNGIRIGAIVAELSLCRFMYVIQGGKCHRRVYLHFIKFKIKNVPIADKMCEVYTKTKKEDRERGVFSPIDYANPEHNLDEHVKDLLKGRKNANGHHASNMQNTETESSKSKDLSKAGMKITSNNKEEAKPKNDNDEKHDPTVPNRLSQDDDLTK